MNKKYENLINNDKITKEKINTLLNEISKNHDELKNELNDALKSEECFDESIKGSNYKCSVCNNNNLYQKSEEKIENSEGNNIIINDYIENNSSLINDINLNNKTEISEKKEDKNGSSSNMIKKFLDEKSKIEKSYDKLINEIINNYSNEKEIYELKLKEKENKIKLFKQAFPLEILNEKEKVLNINFITDDESIHYSIICKNTDKLNQIIEQFYDNFPQYREYKNIFTFKGNEIKMSNTLEENNINSNDIITIKSLL